MDAVTYPTEAVAKFVDYNFIPVEIEVSDTALTQKYVVNWTPAILVLDTDGKEHYRTVGFLAPEAFIGAFRVGKGRYFLDLEQYPEAIAMFDETIDAGAPDNALSEAIFFKVVATYKHTSNPKPLREAYEILNAKYPQTEWAKRAEPYKLSRRKGRGQRG